VLNNVAYMQLSTLRKILHLTKQGLPIVLVGNGPAASAGLARLEDGNPKDVDSEIAVLLSELKNNNSCILVEDVAQVPDALRRINVL
jgi:hypothetical protein